MVEFSGSSSTQYQLEWKAHPQPWTASQSKTVRPGKAEAAPLEPGTTYCVRLRTGGATGKELIVDTEQIKCTDSKGGCCVVQ